MSYATLRNQIIKRRPDLPIKLIDRAYEFAKKAHGGQKRYSGESYIMHPVEVARILLDLNPDLPAMQAALLHDVTEDTAVKRPEVEEAFGKEVADLVEGLEKLAIVKVRTENPQEEKWKKMFLAMAKDIRIVFIKLADRLHNMRTLQFVPPHKQERIARETLGVHAAIASRLGIFQIKSELEDLCFRYLYPEDYKDLAAKLKSEQDRSEECMAFATSQLEQLLMRENVNVVEVQGRLKHLWSIYQKMQKKEAKDIGDIYDLFALRVILPDLFHGQKEQVSHLYNVLGLVHGEYIPLQDRFKDYIAVPKPNGYRSLHTTVLGLGGDIYDEPTEVQIRTLGMHKEAELGVASHWSYKLGKRIDKNLDRKIHFALQNALQEVKALVKQNPDLEAEVRAWIERYQFLTPTERKRIEKKLYDHGIAKSYLAAIQKGRSQEIPILHSSVEQQMAWLRGLAEEGNLKAEIDLYPDRIFVLTPKKQVIELPKGSNPIDFAFMVHTEVGNKMVNAKVNGRIVPFDYELKNGETVEIVTRSNAKPNRYWLSIAKTSSARSKIKNWFNKQDKSANVTAGREMVNRELQVLGKSVLDDKNALLKNYAGSGRTSAEREQLLENVGLGTVTAFQIVKTLFPDETAKARKKGDVLVAAEYTQEVLITGEENLPVLLSACCKPKPPHSIIGYVSRGQFIRIHRKDCRELGGLEDERFISAHWKAKKSAIDKTK